jgi:hypothetical protein
MALYTFREVICTSHHTKYIKKNLDMNAKEQVNSMATYSVMSFDLA